MQSPAFAAVPTLWAGVVPATADTSLTAPTNTTTLGTAGAISQAISAMSVLVGNTVLATVGSTAGMVAGQTLVVSGAAGMSNVIGVWVIQAVISAAQLVFSPSSTPSGTYTASSGTAYVPSPGTKISQIDLVAVGTTVVGEVNVFAYDGSAYHLIESVVQAAFTSSTSSGANKATFTYDSLVLPAGWSLRVTTTVAGDQSLVAVNVFGAAL